MNKCLCCKAILISGRCASCENKTPNQLFIEILTDEKAKYKKALEEIASGRCMLHFEYYDIAKAALNG